MPIPVDNPNFQHDFEGYRLHGRHSIVNSFDYDDGESINPINITSIRGGNIAVLDDPAYDPQSGRPHGGGLIAPFDTSQFKIADKALNRVTTGVDGTILECRDVEITTDETLWFTWAFLPYDSHTSHEFNSFALFIAFDQTDLNSDNSFDPTTSLFKQDLAQSKKIRDESRNNISWQTTSWKPDNIFKGTLCWVVSSGEFGSTTRTPFPGVLLLDSIDKSDRR